MLVAQANRPGSAKIVEDYGKRPLAFEANQGQSDPQVKFLSRGAGYNLFLTSTEAVLTLHEASRQEPALSGLKARISPETRLRESKSAVLRMKLVGSNPKTEVTGQDELPGKRTTSSGMTRRSGTRMFGSLPRYGTRMCIRA